MILGICCALSGSMMWAQLDEGAITGIVKDATGAVIPNAAVTLTNTNTNLSMQGKSSKRGEYVFSPIKIGNYKVSASAPGFETTTQENVHVSIQDRLSIDISLKPGAVQETITVADVPPLLQTESASVGQVMSTDTINATPLNGRNWVYIAQLAAGVAPAIGNNANNPARGGGTGDFSANGQRTTQNNFIMDGVDNNVNVDDFQNGASYNVKPPPDALQEFSVSTSNYSAEFGHSAGAVVNASIKSGGNRIHGDLWEYVRNTIFDAADWDSAKHVVPAYHENQFGATLGGPIWKNKIFYFGDVEANRITYAQPSQTFTVPTMSERSGDLSELFLTGSLHTGKSVPIGVFAPNTGGQLPLTQGGGAVSNPGGATVTAINGQQTSNVLAPGNPSLAGGAVGGQQDKVAAEILAAYPKPNAGGWTSSNLNTPGSGQTYNNYSANLPAKDETIQWDQRVDWNISSNDQAFVRYSYGHDIVSFTPPLGPIIDGGNDVGGFNGANNTNIAQSFTGSESHVFTPNLINEFRLGYNWAHFAFLQANANTPASTLIPGMNGVPFSGLEQPNGGLPWINIGGGGSLSAAGARRDVPSVERQNVYQILDNVTKISGRHSLKFGMQLESIRTSFAQAMMPRGKYKFGGNYSTLFTVTPNSGGPGPNGESDSSVGNTGSGIADMFTDNMSGTSLSPPWNTSYYRWYRAAYAQDDWRVNPKLTVNLGVRYDFIQPMNSNSGSVANILISQAGIAAEGTGTGGGSASGKGFYQLSTKYENVPNLISQSFSSLLVSQNLSLSYANSNSLVTTQKTNFAPRIGVSYQVDQNTVVRSGYGIFFGAIEAPGGSELEQNYPFKYDTNLSNNYLGNWNCFPSTNSGADNTKSYCPSGGTPDGASYPYATSLETGMSTYISNGGIGAFAGIPQLSMADSNAKTPYTESYNLTVEHQFAKTLIASVGYVGNVGKHTYAGTQPFSSMAVTSSSNGYSTSAFPGISLNTSDVQFIGESMYNGLQAKLEKRPSGGLSYLATYTWSHAEDDASNPGIGGGPGLRNSVLIPLKYEFTNSNYDVRHRVTVNGMYDLPFGPGRKYLASNGLMSYLVGGWSTSLTWTAQTGEPIAIGDGSNFKAANGVGINPYRIGNPFKGGGTPSSANPDTGTCPATVKNRTNWFNPCAFADPTSGTKIDIHAYLTDLPSAVLYSGGKTNQIMGPGFERVNMSAFKDFKTWREQYFQFRADAFNLLNHPSWNAPSGASLDLGGGSISQPQSFQNYTPDARFFQLAAKYVF